MNERRVETCLTCFGGLNEVFVCLIDWFSYLYVMRDKLNLVCFVERSRTLQCTDVGLML